MNTDHWDTYGSYNTTDDAATLLDIATGLEPLAEDESELHYMAQALAGIAQRLSRLDTTYPWPDPTPEHWGPRPHHHHRKD